MQNIKYLIMGTFFGTLLYKSEVISWFRIQEMFRFQSFHMYGVMGSAVVVGALSIFLIKRFHAKALKSEPIEIPDKKFNVGYIIGGTLFGMGWALTGACPGPLYTHLGAGTSVMIVAILSALLGAWLYGYLRPKLPH